jgi:hypothetical protein
MIVTSQSASNLPGQTAAMVLKTYGILMSHGDVQYPTDLVKNKQDWAPPRHH